MSKYKKFYRDARERVLSTAGQVAGAIASVEAFVASTGIGAEHWQRLTAYGVVATALAVVKVLAAKKVGDPEDGSLNGVEEGLTREEALEALREKNVEVDEVLESCDREDCPKRGDA